MKRYGLIGSRLAHSYSQRWFSDFFSREGIDAHYGLYELPNLDTLRQWVAHQGLSGFNVTIPYKEAVLPLLDSIEPEAQAIGAVNCVCVSPQGDGVWLQGFNTDVPAFRTTLLPLLQPHHRQALVLGTGGASRAVGYVLRQLGLDASFVSRTPDRHPTAVSYEKASTLASTHTLIVNCTPVGMSPHEEDSPWSYPHLLTPRHLCYDLIYNPAETRFLRQAHAQGSTTCNGMAMLCLQAQASWQHFQSFKENPKR